MSSGYQKRRWWMLLLAAMCLSLPACGADGQLCLFGYSSRPNFDTTIRTVRVPIFQNESYWKNLEFDLTEAVHKEIELRTPYKVVPAGHTADTELVGVVISSNKSVVILDQLGQVRDADTTLSVHVTWRDLRPGFHGDPLDAPVIDPTTPLPPPEPAPPEKALVQSIASFRPELGESLTTAQQRMVKNMARRIVNMMEKRW